MVQHPEESKSRLRDAFLLCLLLFVLYNLNFRLVRVDDSVPSRLLPFSQAAPTSAILVCGLATTNQEKAANLHGRPALPTTALGERARL